MTNFVHLEYSNQHPGVARVEAAIESVSTSAQQIKRNFSSTRSLATLLLSAMAAAAMVVAYQVMDSMAEGHLLALWIGLWAVAFAALALFAGTASTAASRIKTGLDNWSANLAKAKADERLWAAAMADPRVMADVQYAMNQQDETLTFVAPGSTVGKALPKQAEPVVSRFGLIPPYKPQYI